MSTLLHFAMWFIIADIAIGLLYFVIAMIAGAFTTNKESN